MASSPQFPERPRGPRLVDRREPNRNQPFPWVLVTAILTILVAITIAWYFFR
jgi:hypothetical protein